jgi:hypothetical protein
MVVAVVERITTTTNVDVVDSTTRRRSYLPSLD